MPVNAPAAPVFLQPCEVFTGDSPARVKTVVGSCLAIMIRAPRLGLTAVAHCMLPEAGVPADTLPFAEALRYVDTTIELLLRAFVNRGASAAEMEVKLFGGADSMGVAGEESGYLVGRRNTEAARIGFAARGLAVAASDVGGRRGRVVEFNTETGDVLVKALPGQPARKQAERR